MKQAHIAYRHHTHHQAPDITICSSNAFGMTIVIFSFPSRVPRRRESEGATFIPVSGIRLKNPLARDTLNASRTERLTGGDDC